jgi:putative peptidoglycan lipid II flippase
MIRSPFLVMRIAFVGFAIAAAVATHMPNGLVPSDRPTVMFGMDRWMHVVVFAIWSGLLLGTRWIGRPTGRTLGIGVAIGLGYVVVDELTQVFSVERNIDLGDLGASSVGIVIGAGVWRLARFIDQPTEGFVSHARVMSALTLVSRLFGLVRDWALAYLLGFGWVFDAFVVAFMIPNLFRRLFGEGALAGAFVPHYTQFSQRDPQTANRFAWLIVASLRNVLGGIALLGVAVLVILLVAGGLDDRGRLIAQLTIISLWYMPLVCVAAILGAMLQVHGKFAVPSASPILLNVCLIVGVLIAVYLHSEQLAPARQVFIVIAAVVIAGALQVLWHAISLHDQRIVPPTGGARAIWRSDASVRSTTRAMLRQWAPTVIGLAVFQINTLADALIAMFFSPVDGARANATLHLFGHELAYPMASGSVAVLGAAARLYEFPLGVFGIAIATAIFPALSRAAGDRAAFTDLVRRGLRLTVFIGLPASVGLMLVRHPATHAIYAAVGRIDAHDSARVAWVLLGYAPAVWAYSMNHVLVRAFYAQHNPTAPMKVSVAMVVLNIVLNLSLIWLPVGGGERLGAAGLAWSTATCAILQCAILLLLVRRYADRPVDRSVGLSWLRTVVITAVMAGAVWLIVDQWHVIDGSRWRSIGVLAAAVASGGLIVVLGARLLRGEELRWALARRRE